MEFQKKMKNLAKSLDDIITIAEGTAAQDLLANMEFRIFNDGFDSDSKTIGFYSEDYKELRKQRGLQVDYVDLTYSTNLKNSIVQIENKVLFKNLYGINISAKNERHFKKDIFNPSEKERDRAIDIMRDEFYKLFK